MDRKQSYLEPVLVGACSCAIAPIVLGIFFFLITSGASDNPFPFTISVMILNLTLGAVIGGFITYLFTKTNRFDESKLRELRNGTIGLVAFPTGFITVFLIMYLLIVTNYI